MARNTKCVINRGNLQLDLAEAFRIAHGRELQTKHKEAIERIVYEEFYKDSWT